jgi:NADH-ubiquinone oxidoreductase chain 4
MFMLLRCLGGVLFVGFISKCFFTYFIFFELSLFPTAFLIIVFGGNPERFRAVYYFLLYTSLASFPLLVNILGVWGDAWDYFFLGGDESFFGVMFWWVSLFWGLAFLVKTPIFGGHLWLPKAHVEAPTVGRMVLAALLLKLGILGVFRVSGVFPHPRFVIGLTGWLLLGMVFSSLIRFRSMDIKIFIAYSSVAHMGLVLVGFVSFSFVSFLGLLMIGVGHGLRRSGLFSFVGDFYKFAGGRKLLLRGNLVNLNPILCGSFFLLCSSKASVPPCFSIFGEVSVFVGLSHFGFIFTWFVRLYVFLVGLYNFYLYLKVSHGSPNQIILYGGGFFPVSGLILFSLGIWGFLLFFLGRF